MSHKLKSKGVSKNFTSKVSQDRIDKNRQPKSDPMTTTERIKHQIDEDNLSLVEFAKRRKLEKDDAIKVKEPEIKLSYTSIGSGTKQGERSINENRQKVANNLEIETHKVCIVQCGKFLNHCLESNLEIEIIDAKVLKHNQPSNDEERNTVVCSPTIGNQGHLVSC